MRINLQHTLKILSKLSLKLTRAISKNSNPNKINQFLVTIFSEIGNLTVSLEFTQKKLTSIGEGEKNKLDD